MFSDYEKELYAKIKNSDHYEIKNPKDEIEKQKLADAIEHLSDTGYIIIIESPEDGCDNYFVERSICTQVTEEM